MFCGATRSHTQLRGPGAPHRSPLDGLRPAQLEAELASVGHEVIASKVRRATVLMKSVGFKEYRAQVKDGVGAMVLEGHTSETLENANRSKKHYAFLKDWANEARAFGSRHSFRKHSSKRKRDTGAQQQGWSEAGGSSPSSETRSTEEPGAEEPPAEAVLEVEMAGGKLIV